MTTHKDTLATRIARAIFEHGDEPIGLAARKAALIQFVDGNSFLMRALDEAELARVIESAIIQEVLR